MVRAELGMSKGGIPDDLACSQYAVAVECGGKRDLRITKPVLLEQEIKYRRYIQDHAS